MAHLAAGTRFRLAIETQTSAGLFENFVPSVDLVADQIAHFDRRAMACRGTERPAGNGAMCCSNCEVTAPSSVQWPELCTRDEILSQPVEVLLPARLRDRHHAQRAHYQSAAKPRAMNEAGILVGQDKAGRERPIDIMLTPIAHGSERLFMAVIRDMTKQKRMEDELAQHCADLEKSQAALAQQNAVLDAALNNMTHGLAMYDAAGSLIVCNEKFRELYAISDEEPIIGRSWDELLDTFVGKGFVKKNDERSSDWRRVLSNDEKGAVHLDLTDGRTLAITHRQIANGGSVAVHRDVTEHLRAEEEIHRLATHDFLTGLPNRLFLEEVIANLRRARRPSEMLALHYLDLDRFKQVNDSLGHRYGDLLLQAVANRLSHVVRPGDIIARIGGDEFVIVQPGVPNAGAAASLATRIIAKISEPFRLEAMRAHIGVSIGITLCHGKPNLAELLKEADAALYEAKENGKGQACVFSGAEAQERLSA